MLPIGSIVSIGWLPVGSSLKVWESRSGWMYCDGRTRLKEDYKALFNAIKYNFGSGWDADLNKTTGDFNLPDLRGRFIRGVDDSGKGFDPDAGNRSAMSPGGSAVGVGSIQGDQTRKHAHAAGLQNAPFSSVHVSAAEWKSGFAAGGLFGDGGAAGVSRNPGHIGVTLGDYGGAENRPINAALYWIIKYKDVSAADMAGLNAELERDI